MSARKKLTIAGSFLVLSLLCIALVASLVFPKVQPAATTGEHSVAVTQVTLTDKNRLDKFSKDKKNRQVNVSYWYPSDVKDGSRFPLIVFSHGGLATEKSNETLFRELASHGYIVASLGHPHHTLWTKDTAGQTTFVSATYFQELQRENARQDKQQSFSYYQKWLEDRTGDINFVLDAVLKMALSQTPGVYSLIDANRLGVMGHSLGGSAALAVPRQRRDISAVIALEAPFLYDITGVEGNKFLWRNEPYPIPVLNIYSDSSWAHLSDWPQYAENAALLSIGPSNKAANLYLPGGGHFSLTDLSLVSPLLTNLLEGKPANPDRSGYLQKVNQACLDFFDQTLKGKNQPDAFKPETWIRQIHQKNYLSDAKTSFQPIWNPVIIFDTMYHQP